MGAGFRKSRLAGVWLVATLGLASCAGEGPKLESLTAYLADGGVVLAPPSGLAAPGVLGVQDAMNDMAGGPRPSITFLETAQHGQVTICRFEREKDARRYLGILEALRGQLSGRVDALAGPEERVRRGNFVLVIRFRPEDADQKERLLKLLARFPLR